MNLWHETMDDLADIQRDAGQELTLEQRIQIAQIHALLSISQELSSINPQNTSYTDSDGNGRNGWGMLTHER